MLLSDVHAALRSLCMMQLPDLPDSRSLDTSLFVSLLLNEPTRFQVLRCLFQKSKFCDAERLKGDTIAMAQAGFRFQSSGNTRSRISCRDSRRRAQGRVETRAPKAPNLELEKLGALPFKAVLLSAVAGVSYSEQGSAVGVGNEPHMVWEPAMPAILPRSDRRANERQAWTLKPPIESFEAALGPSCRFNNNNKKKYYIYLVFLL